MLLSLAFYGCREKIPKREITKDKSPKEITEILDPYPEIYDSINGKFTEKIGGIEEKVINENINCLNKEDFWKYKIVDSIENYSKFRKSGPSEALFSKVETLLRMVENFRTLKETDETNILALKEEYIPLKKLMIKLDSIRIKNPKLNYKTLKDMYTSIGESINPSYEKTDLKIQDVTAGKGGICRDLVSTYYPLLAYYGFEGGFKFGSIGNTSHIWLYTKLEENNFELDPSWYQENMIPIENRIEKDTTYETLKDEYIIKKFKNKK